MVTETEQTDKRRLKIMIVDEQLMLDVILGLSRYDCVAIPEPIDTPDDLEVVGVQYSISRRAFLFLVRSKTFEPVPIAEEVSMLYPDFTFRKRIIKIPKEEYR